MSEEVFYKSRLDSLIPPRNTVFMRLTSKILVVNIWQVLLKIYVC